MRSFAVIVLVAGLVCSCGKEPAPSPERYSDLFDLQEVEIPADWGYARKQYDVVAKNPIPEKTVRETLGGHGWTLSAVYMVDPDKTVTGEILVTEEGPWRSNENTMPEYFTLPSPSDKSTIFYDPPQKNWNDYAFSYDESDNSISLLGSTWVKQGRGKLIYLSPDRMVCVRSGYIQPDAKRYVIRMSVFDRVDDATLASWKETCIYHIPEPEFGQ